MTANRQCVATGHIGPHSGSTPHMTVSREWWEGTAQSATYQARQAEQRDSESRLRAEARREHVRVVERYGEVVLEVVETGGRTVYVELGATQHCQLMSDLFVAWEARKS